MKELNIIKEQIKILLESGYIFEVKKGEYKGLGIKDTLYIQMKGGLKEDGKTDN